MEIALAIATDPDPRGRNEPDKPYGFHEQADTSQYPAGS